MALPGRADDLGVGQGEIGRCNGVDELAGVEVDLVLRLAIEALDIVHRRMQPARREQVGLLEIVEQQVFAPFGIAKSPVVFLGFDQGRAFDAHHSFRGVLPQRHGVLPQRHLGLGEARRVGHHLRRHIEESAADVERVDIALDQPFVVPRHEVGDDPPALLGDPCKIHALIGARFGRLVLLWLGHTALQYKVSHRLVERAQPRIPQVFPGPNRAGARAPANARL